MTSVVTWVALLMVLVAGACALDRLGLWMERRGWVYYRKKRGSVPLGRAVLETQALMDPSKRYVLEATRTSPDEGQSGDPPK